MRIKQAEFIISNTDIKKCPKADIPEYAFIGRSNVGKSSLINMLTERKNLAKVSGKPGKTQLINHFLINKLWYLVKICQDTVMLEYQKLSAMSLLNLSKSIY